MSTSSVESGQTLSEMAFESIMALIMSGELAPGAIVTELDIARRLSISRGPVREAFRQLEGRKLIVREAFQRPRVVSLGLKEIKEIFEVREGLEAVACRLATESMSDGALKRLMAELESSRSPRRRKTFDLHWEIARQCGNRRITELLCNELYSLVRIYRRVSGAAPGRGDAAYQEHWQIVRAMQARDADLAGSLMREHIRRATGQLTELGRAGGGKVSAKVRASDDE